MAENMSDLIVPLMANYDALVAPATTSGKTFARALPALLDVMQISEITAVNSDGTFERPAYAGNAIQTVKSTMLKKSSPCVRQALIVLMRADQLSIETIDAPADSGLTSYVSEKPIEI